MDVKWTHGFGERAVKMSKIVRTEWIGSSRVGWPRKYLPGVVLLLVSSCFILLRYHNSVIANYGEGLDCSPLPVSFVQVSEENPGRALVNAIREATRLASGKVNSSTPELSFEDLQSWEDLHPCESRGPAGLESFYNRREHTESLQPNPLWDEVFQEYSKLHRTCMQNVGDIADYFLQQNSSSGCKFVIADIADKTGFGNKVLVLASSLLYAIVTQRVILIPSSTTLPSYMCEPFAGSSWLLSGSRLPLPPTSFRNSWKLEKQIFKEIDRLRSRCTFPSVPQIYAAGIRRNQWQPQQRFYCSHEQSAYSQATFVYLSGCLYTIPKLFATSLFRPTLEALFPDKIVATRLLRSAFLPADPVWKRVVSIDQNYLQPSHRRIGIQLRYNGRALKSYEDMNYTMNERVVDCLTQNDLLHNVSENREPLTLPRNAQIPVVYVFIASLFTGLKDHLINMYGRHLTTTGEAVRIVQVSHNGRQKFDAEEDIEAFSEVLLLSFSDHMFVTPVSTLGSVAHAYGGLIPWFLEARKHGKGHEELRACERGQTIEACNQFSKKTYSCPADASINGKLIADVLPYVNDCLAIDHEQGIQLLTSS